MTSTFDMNNELDREIALIRESGLFDENWYLAEYPDVKVLGMDPVVHYISVGAMLLRNPAPVFDTRKYLETYEDVANAGFNPLIHYLRWGAAEGRCPAPVSTVQQPKKINSSSAEVCSATTARKNTLPQAIAAAKVAFRAEDWPGTISCWQAVLDRFGDNEPVAGLARTNLSITRRLAHIEAYKDEIVQYATARATRHSQPIEEKRIAIYTSVTGGYDSLRLPETLEPRFDYILFTDATAPDTGVYQVRPIKYFHEDSTRMARFIKTHPQKLLAGYDIAVWIDANITIVGDIYTLVEDFIASGQAVAGVRHPLRSSAYEEFEACLKDNKDNRSLMQEQIAHYRQIGFDHDDLIETNLMMFRLQDDRIRPFLNLWWSEIDANSKRDQLSVNYSLKQTGVNWHRLMDRPVSVRNHPMFAYGPHGRHDDGEASELISELQVPLIDPYTELADTAPEQKKIPKKKTKPENTSLQTRVIPASPTSSHTQMRVVQFTPSQTENSYYMLLPAALRRMGCNIECMTDWRAVNSPEKTQSVIVHFHQLEPYYHRVDAKATWAAARELIRKIENLVAQGVQLVLTWHNPYPHDRRYLEIDAWLYDQLGPLVSRVIVHLRSAISFVESYVDRSKIAYVPHPSFLGVYGEPQDRAESRRKLGIPNDVFVFLSFGAVKAYKGHDLLASAWKAMKAQSSADHAMLCVAGRCHDNELLKSLRDLEHTKLELEHIPDDAVATWLAAADVGVYTHREIWTSGAAILAMSYGLPVILPDLPYTREYVRDEDNGFLFAPYDANTLKSTMLRALHSPFLEHIQFMNRVFARKYMPDVVAARLAALYGELA